MNRTDILIREGIVLIIPIITVVFYFLLKADLPERIPLYTMLTGNIAAAWVPVAINVLLYLIYLFIPRPRHGDCCGKRFIISILVILYTNISAVMVMEQLAYDTIHIERMFVIALLFAITFIGFIMHPGEPAFRLGIPTPWNTGLPEVWNHTQRFTSHLWSITGTISTFTAIFVNNFWLYYYFMGILLILVILPFWVSYKEYTRMKGL